MASRKPKQYGLILPSKAAVASTSSKGKNVFGPDSDSDPDDGGDWVKKSLKRDAQSSVLKRTTKIQLKKALEEDPTVFQYDEVYDDLEQKKEEAKSTKKDVEKKPRYIQQLLQTAERRKKENERRIERQVQKEREEEGEQFADKESFVTSSYRQKLEEFKKQEEEEKRMERLEAIGDVTKQKDLTGFYRHLFRQTMGESLPGANNSIEAEKKGGDVPSNTKASLGGGAKQEVTMEERKKDRQYRKRRSSSSSDSDSNHNDSNHVVKDKNIDDDSDFTGPSSSSSESDGSVTTCGSEDGEIIKKKKVPKEKMNEEESKTQRKEPKRNDDDIKKDSTVPQPLKSNPVSEILPEEEDDAHSNNVVTKPKEKSETEIKSEKDVSESKDSVKVVKLKIDIWVKRTVGQVFDDAVQRYYERKSAKAALRLGRA